MQERNNEHQDEHHDEHGDKGGDGHEGEGARVLIERLGLAPHPEGG